jgi:hypothetical protein
VANPTAVNTQITDAVTQSNVQVLGAAPGQAMATLYAAMGQSLALAAANATAHQQNVNVITQAITARAVRSILGGPRIKTTHE